jgi:glycosyltransferase involved in cell wall biosynthesis
MTTRILVLVPCYNCRAQVPRVLRQFTAATAGHFEEVLVLDNHSTDDTVAQALAAMPQVHGARVTVARNHRNVNLGGSHKAAFAYARRHGFTHVAVLHGDDQGSLADLVAFMRGGAHLRHDACLGARFQRGARLQGYSRLRILGNHVFNALFTLGTGHAVHDLGSGLNLFGERVFRDLPTDRYADDLRFNVFLLLGIIQSGCRYTYFPISWREDDQVSNVKMVSQATRTLDMLWRYRRAPQRFLQGEHRDVPHDDYGFEVLGTHEPPDAGGVPSR